MMRVDRVEISVRGLWETTKLLTIRSTCDCQKNCQKKVVNE
jgi:hypothetical protein